MHKPQSYLNQGGIIRGLEFSAQRSAPMRHQIIHFTRTGEVKLRQVSAPSPLPSLKYSVRLHSFPCGSVELPFSRHYPFSPRLINIPSLSPLLHVSALINGTSFFSFLVLTVSFPTFLFLPLKPLYSFSLPPLSQAY